MKGARRVDRACSRLVAVQNFHGGIKVFVAGNLLQCAYRVRRQVKIDLPQGLAGKLGEFGVSNPLQKRLTYIRGQNWPFTAGRFTNQEAL